MNNYLLSVIIPVYNGQEFVPKLVETLAAHNTDIWPQIEVILVNDGSKDNSLSVSESLATKFANVKVIDQENKGIAGARNTALQKASGEYITFCDQDDSVCKGYESFLRLVKSNDSDLLISNYDMRTDDNVIHRDNIKKESVFDNQQAKLIIRYILAKEVLLPKDSHKDIPRTYPSIWNCLFKRSFLMEHGIEIHRYVSYEDDWMLLINSLLASSSVSVTQDRYYEWNIRQESESHVVKEIPSYLPKRALLREWYQNCCKKIELSEQETVKALSVFDKDTVQTAFMFYSQHSFFSCIREMRQLHIPENERQLIISYATNRGERFFLSMLARELWTMAFLTVRLYLKCK